MNSYEITHWVKLTPGIVAYEVNGCCLFPLYGNSGSIMARNAIFLAKNRSDFPEFDFPIEPGLSANGKIYTLILGGNRKYEQGDVDELLTEANKCLS